MKTYHYLGFKWHIVEQITDENENLYVVKRWRKAKQRWHYEVLDDFMFNYIMDGIKNEN